MEIDKIIWLLGYSIISGCGITLLEIIMLGKVEDAFPLLFQKYDENDPFAKYIKHIEKIPKKEEKRKTIKDNSAVSDSFKALYKIKKQACLQIAKEKKDPDYDRYKNLVKERNELVEEIKEKNYCIPDKGPDKSQLREIATATTNDGRPDRKIYTGPNNIILYMEDESGELFPLAQQDRNLVLAEIESQGQKRLESRSRPKTESDKLFTRYCKRLAHVEDNFGLESHMY